MFIGCPISPPNKPDFNKQKEIKDLEPGDGEWTLGQKVGKSDEKSAGGKKYKRRKTRKTMRLRKKRRSKRR
jgi:hypothetical protein